MEKKKEKRGQKKKKKKKHSGGLHIRRRRKAILLTEFRNNFLGIIDCIFFKKHKISTFFEFERGIKSAEEQPIKPSTELSCVHSFFFFFFFFFSTWDFFLTQVHHFFIDIK